MRAIEIIGVAAGTCQRVPPNPGHRSPALKTPLAALRDPHSRTPAEVVMRGVLSLLCRLGSSAMLSLVVPSLWDQSAWAGPASSEVLGIGTYRALLIGVDDYAANSGIPDLATPTRDVERLRGVLVQKYAFEESNVRVLSGATATREAILRALDQLSAASGPDDAVLIYYAGHGSYNEQAMQGYWLPADATAASRASWISNADVSDTLRAMPARHVMLLVDSCFAGSLLTTREVGVAEKVLTEEVQIRKLSSKRSRYVITSGGVEPVADQYRGTGSSIFNYFLVQLLADQDSEYVNLLSLFPELERLVTNNNEAQQPDYGPLKVVGDEGGRLLLVNRGARVDVQALAAKEKAHEEEEAQALADWVAVSPLLERRTAGTRDAVSGWLKNWDALDLPQEETARAWLNTYVERTEQGSPDASPGGHLSRGLAIGGGIAAIGAIAGAIGALSTEARAREAESISADDLQQVTNLNHVYAVSGLVLGAGAGGLVVSAVVAGRW